MAFGDTDRDVFLADLGVDVTANSVTVKGLLKNDDIVEQTNQLSGYEFQMRRMTVLVKTGALANLKVDDAITVDGTSCQVRSIDLVGDGAFTRVTVSRA